MTRRDFLGAEFYAWLQHEHDLLRQRIKRGSSDPTERALLAIDRDWAQTLHRMMGMKP